MAKVDSAGTITLYASVGLGAFAGTGSQGFGFGQIVYVRR